MSEVQRVSVFVATETYGSLDFSILQQPFRSGLGESRQRVSAVYGRQAAKSGGITQPARLAWPLCPDVAGGRGKGRKS